MSFFDKLALFPFHVHLLLGFVFFGLIAWIVTVAYFGVRLLRLETRERAFVSSRKRAIALVSSYVVACLVLGYFTPIGQNFISSAVGLFLLGLVIGLFLWPILGKRAVILILSFVTSFRLADLLAGTIIKLSTGSPPSAMSPEWSYPLLIVFQVVFALLFMAMVSVAVGPAFGTPRRGLQWAALAGGLAPQKLVVIPILLSGVLLNTGSLELQVLWTSLVQKYAFYFIFSLPLLLCLLSRQTDGVQTASSESP